MELDERRTEVVSTLDHCGPRCITEFKVQARARREPLRRHRKTLDVLEGTPPRSLGYAGEHERGLLRAILHRQEVRQERLMSLARKMKKHRHHVPSRNRSEKPFTHDKRL